MSTNKTVSMYEVRLRGAKGTVKVLGTSAEFLVASEESPQLILVIRKGNKTVYLSDAYRVEEVIDTSARVEGLKICK